MSEEELKKLFKVDKWKYFDMIQYKPHPRQRLFHESTARFKIPVCGRRMGKLLEIHTPIPTPNGTIPIGSIEPGDIVFDENGNPTTVIGVSEIQARTDAFLVVFDDGNTLIAHGEHEWLTYDKPARKAMTDPRRHTKPKVRTTNEIRSTLHTTTSKPEANHAIPMAGPVQHSKKDLPIDPYLLGVWLGDGSSSDGSLTIPDNDSWIIDKLIARGAQIHRVENKDRCPSWRVSGLRVELRDNMLLGNKHVPEEYLYGSIEQRQDLLFGLMDTDGTADKNKVDFYNTNKNIADAVAHLIVSLGGKVSRSERVGKLYGVEKKLCYRVHTGNYFDLFSLPRKLNAQHKIPRRAKLFRFIENVLPIDATVLMKCIAVDSPSHLYLAGKSYIPTHNTIMGARELEPVLMTPNKRVWIVSPTYDLGEKEFRVIWDDMIIKLGLGKERSIRRSYAKKQGSMSIEFPWNSAVEVRSADRPEHLVGDGLDYVVMSEASKHSEETWVRFIRPALTDRRGKATFSSTPDGMNYLYKLWQMGRDPNEPDYESWQFPSWDNPFVYPLGRNDPEILQTERTTSREVFLQEYAADFTSFSGKVYSEFEENTHVQHVPYNPNLRNYIAFDWGFVAPMAAIEFQVDSMQRVRVWREHYKSRLRLKDFLGELKSRPQPPGYRIDLCFGDAADPEAVTSVSQDFSPCYADPLSKSNWREGVELVQGFLRTQETGETDEYGTPVMEPWLVVDHSCVNLIREFNNYRTSEPGRGRERNPREDAQKWDDHALDALRYGMMHVFKLGATQSLSSVVTREELSAVEHNGYFTSGIRFA